jgi:UDP-N-acetylmuramate--alanine ligase
MSIRRLDRRDDFMQGFRRIHFVGIGGAGMSGIAEVLARLGYRVSGSDLVRSESVRRLEGLGVEIHLGHRAEHVDDADALVVSSAIAEDNPEWIEARRRRIPIVPRAEMLGELMRFRRGIAVAGTHGKTTTTSLIASVLAEGGLDPTFVIGGRLLAHGSHAALGEGEWLVAEADESDGSFLKLMPVIAVVTNVDADHLVNFGGDFQRLVEAFDNFLHRLPFYGLAVICRDDPHAAHLLERCPRRALSYGLGAEADFRASDIRQEAARMRFSIHLPDRPEPLPAILNLPGVHNVQNALAATAVGWQLAVPVEGILRALEAFRGVGRRFERLGELSFARGRALVVDDYAHHPRELQAVIQAARGGWPERRLVLLFQPHRYTRTRDLLDDFAEVLSEVDLLLLTEVYPAGEAPISHADGRALARAVRGRGRVEPVFLADLAHAEAALDDLVMEGDLLLVAGAGDIGAWIRHLAGSEARR